MKILVYTDGACSGNPGPGGWGAVILVQDKEYHLSGFEQATTNNRMELKAVLEALKLAVGIGASHAVIHSDSAYVVSSINENRLISWFNKGWKTQQGTEVKNQDLWVKILRQLAKLETRFIKVRGHSGDRYNEMADKLARGEIEANIF